MATQTPPRDETLVDAALDLIHRTNNFLTLCMAHSEGALGSDDPAELADALRSISSGAREMASYSHSARGRVLAAGGAPAAGGGPR